MGQKPTSIVKKNSQDTAVFLWWWIKTAAFPEWIAIFLIKIIQKETELSQELKPDDFFHLIPPIPPRPPFIAYHPALPTIHQLQDNYDCAISPHLPILTEMTVANEKVCIISWNVVTNDLENIFGRNNVAETPLQKERRYQRITNALTAFITNNAPVHFITLQNMDSDVRNKLFGHILDTLESFGWKNGSSSQSNADVRTLYNTKLYTHKNNAKNSSELHGEISIYERIGNAHMIEILNVHDAINVQSPVINEKKIKLYLGTQQKNTTKIAIGDFNCPIAPVETTCQNFVTSVKSPFFDDQMAQSAYASAGAFYQKFVDAEIVIKQAKCRYLNLYTGLMITKANHPPIQITNVKRGLQVYEILRYRPIISLDYRLQNEPWIDGKTLKVFEQALQQEYGAEVYVRDARNLTNDRAMALIMPAKYPLKNFIKIFFHGIEDFQPRMIEGNAKIPAILCIPEKHITAFNHFIFSDELSDFLVKRRAIIPDIEKEFYTYNHPRFFNNRGMSMDATNVFEDKIYRLLKQGKILQIFIECQNEWNSYSKDDPNKSGSYKKRLIKIRTLLEENFPDIAKLAKPFCDFLKTHPELVHAYAAKVHTLLIQGIGCDEEKYSEQISALINELTPVKEHKQFINAMIEALETYQIHVVHGISFPPS